MKPRKSRLLNPTDSWGTGPVPIQTADQVAETMIQKLIAAVRAQKGEKALLIINGSGATTLMEMFIVWRKAAQVLKDAGVEVVSGRCDEILTVQESAGFQMFLAILDDDALEGLNAPADAPYWVVR